MFNFMFTSFQRRHSCLIRPNQCQATEEALASIEMKMGGSNVAVSQLTQTALTVNYDDKEEVETDRMNLVMNLQGILEPVGSLLQHVQVRPLSRSREPL